MNSVSRDKVPFRDFLKKASSIPKDQLSRFPGGVLPKVPFSGFFLGLGAPRSLAPDPTRAKGLDASWNIAGLAVFYCKGTVVGFYTLSAASILLSSLPDETARKRPRYPSVPAIRLGRLAVAASTQGQHIGSLLVLDTLRRACRNELAWAVFLVDAKNERAATFYESLFFPTA